MHHLRAVIRPVAVMSIISLLALVAGCSKPANTGTASAAPAATQSNPAPQANAASKLGDLTAFRTIAVEVSNIVDKGDLPVAKVRIKDLEIAWDSAEAGLKPRAADHWHVLDKAIDHALAALRADTPSQANCKTALANLLRAFDSLQGKA
ncbi:MAG: hypothetical protein ABIS68_02330 [Casimicrobiaceae bacterium]